MTNDENTFCALTVISNCISSSMIYTDVCVVIDSFQYYTFQYLMYNAFISNGNSFVYYRNVSEIFTKKFILVI